MERLFEDMDQLRLANRAAGEDFFDKTGVENLCTRVETYLIGGQYFVTSELDPADPTHRDRRCSVRRALPSGRIETVGDFQAYESIPAAQQAIRKIMGSSS